MAILNNAFTCSNGHSFEANAKLRARCPECGVTARRNFVAKTEPEPKVDPPKVDPPKTEPKEPVKKPVLLSQGRPRLPRTTHTPKKPTIKAKIANPLRGKVSSGLVKSTKISRRGTMPVIKTRPKKTAVARTIQNGGGSNPRGRKPFWHEVADKYGF